MGPGYARGEIEQNQVDYGENGEQSKLSTNVILPSVTKMKTANLAAFVWAVT